MLFRRQVLPTNLMIYSFKPRPISEKELPALSFRSNFIWNFIGNSTYAASQLGILVILARFGGAEDVGKFSLGLSIAAPVIMLSNLQLRQVQASDVRDQFAFKHYFALRTLTSTWAFPVVVLFALIGGYTDDSVLVIVIIGAAKCFESISDIAYGLFQRHERMDMSAISMLLNGPLSLVMLGVGFALSRSVVLAAAILALTRLGTVLGYDLRRSRAILARTVEEPAPRILGLVFSLLQTKPAEIGCYRWDGCLGLLG